MPTFSSKPIGQSGSSGWSAVSKVAPKVRRHPVLLFGVPFVLTIVAGSFGLSHLTQTRYDYNASKVQTISKQDELGMRKDRRKVDIREEYFRLQAKGSELDDWEPKRIERPAGVPEWGVPPTDRSGNALQAEELPPGQSDPFSTRSSKAGQPKVILGPDGKPCRACNSKLAFSAAMKSSQGGRKDQESQASVTNALGMNVATSRLASSSALCPPDGDAIGNSTWTFLHSAAAYYPPRPSSAQQASMIALIDALPNLYPCHSCAQALSQELLREKKENKSWEGGKVLQEAVKSGPGLRKWLCGLHNEVNERLGKPKWNCDESLLQTKWLTGPEDGSCD